MKILVESEYQKINQEQKIAQAVTIKLAGGAIAVFSPMKRKVYIIKILEIGINNQKKFGVVMQSLVRVFSFEQMSQKINNCKEK